MSSFKKNLKDNVIAPYIKYNRSHSKLAEVLDANSKKGTCTISYVNVDGINVVKNNVAYKKSFLRGFLGGFPEKGDIVEIQETNKHVRIIDIVDNNLITESNTVTSDINSGNSDLAGYLGI